MYCQATAIDVHLTVEPEQSSENKSLSTFREESRQWGGQSSSGVVAVALQQEPRQIRPLDVGPGFHGQNAINNWNWTKCSFEGVYKIQYCLHLNFSSLVPLVTKTKRVKSSLNVTPLPPPTRLKICSDRELGTHSPNTSWIKT